jgi:hypothetical protein
VRREKRSHQHECYYCFRLEGWTDRFVKVNCLHKNTAGGLKNSFKWTEPYCSVQFDFLHKPNYQQS